MRLYVVGFLFSKDRKQVALIRKTHPEWQAGKLNGPGGKVEDGDIACAFPFESAMSREFAEEVGLSIPTSKWDNFCQLQGTNGNYKGEPGSESSEPFTVCFFRSFGDLTLAESKTEEKLEIVDVSDLPLHKTISNLQWLIPMALTMELTPVSLYQISERV